MATTGDQPPGLIGRVAGAVTGRVAEVVPPDVLLDHVDIDRLIARIDPNDLLDRVDVNALLDRIDVNRLLARVDLDALLAEADIEALVRRSGVPDLVTSSTTQIAGSVIDVARRQVVGLDTIIDRAIDRILRRHPDPAREAPPALRTAAEPADAEGAEGAEGGAKGRLGVTGRYAGPVSRLLAAAADVAIASALFTLGVAGVNVLTEAFFSTSLSGDTVGFWGLAAWLTWAFLYVWISLTIAGRTPGKALVGIRVVASSGLTLGAGQALVRTLAMPVSVAVGGLGLLLALPHPQHKALHDVVARTAVVYDWGDRPAELPGPLSAYVARHSGDQG